MRSFLILTVIAVMAATGRSADQTEAPAAAKPLQLWLLCDAFNQMARLDGQVVAVRGTLQSTDHGLFLVEPACREPILLDGHSYSRILYLTSPGSPYCRKAADFSFDRSAHEGALTPNPDGRAKRLIVIGRLDGFPYAEGMLNGIRVKLGFGPENAAPVQLVMKDVLEIADRASAH